MTKTPSVKIEFKRGSPTINVSPENFGYLLHSSALFDIAKRAARDAATNDSVFTDVLVAIVFSVIGAEAFINETAELASDMIPGEESEPRKLKAFVDFIKQAEEAHGSLEFKYHIARWVFSGEVPDKGINPYQDFDLLVDVRNTLVHFKLLEKIKFVEDGVLMEPPKLLERLRSKNVLVEPPPGMNTPWLFRILTEDMAIWACSTSSAMVKDIVALMPQGGLKTKVAALAKPFDMD
jgi:hypothetical protein